MFTRVRAGAGQPKHTKVGGELGQAEAIAPPELTG